MPEDGIHSPVGPRVVMVREQHDLRRHRGIGIGPGQACDHVADRAHLARDVEGEAQPGRTGPDVIREGPAPLPGELGADGTAERLQDLARVLEREGQARDLRQDGGLGLRDAARARHRGPARRERIAGHDEVVDVGPALEVALRTPGSLGIDVALDVPVLRGIGIGDEGGDATLLRLQALAAAIAAEVPGQRDLAPHVDAETGERVVVLGPAVVDVHDVGGERAALRVRVPGQGEGRLAAARVLGQDGLRTAQRHRARRDQRHLDAPRRGEEDVVAHHLRLQTGLAHPRRDQLRDPPRAVRARHVGRARELGVLRLAPLGGGEGQERRLHLALLRRGCGREAQERRLVRRARGDAEEQGERGGQGARGPHVARIVPEAARPEGAEPAW